MAGHSKWANIKHRKGAQDAARAKLFAKFAKEIMVAAALGGPDPTSNSSLRLAISKAKAKSMPKSNIENAINKGAGTNKGEGSNFREIIYSGTLKGGIQLIVLCLTDNYNRLSSEIQYLFKKANGNIGKQGSIPYGFERKGLLELEIQNLNMEEFELAIMELDIEDYKIEDGFIEIYTNPSKFDFVKQNLEKAGFGDFKTAEVTFISLDKIKIENKEDAEQFLSTIERFEDNDDIQEVFHNVDLSILED